MLIRIYPHRMLVTTSESTRSYKQFSQFHPVQVNPSAQVYLLEELQMVFLFEIHKCIRLQV